jgi:hypothetical protein
VMMWKMASMRNWNVYSINSLNTTWKFFGRFKCQSRQRGHF